MAVGIFGGTFDPVHIGHLILAETAADEFGLDRVLFLPAGNPYLKTGLHVSPAEHRRAMVELAIEDNPRFELSDIELRNPGPSYTIETLDRLRAELPGDEPPCLLLGADAVAEMPRWKCPEDILDRARVVAYPRSARHSTASQSSMSILGRTVPVLDGPLIGVSGTEIRKRVADGRSIRYLVPGPVIDYIQRTCLYSSCPSCSSA